MTRDDTKRILDKICRLYITQAKKMSTDEMVMMLDSWRLNRDIKVALLSVATSFIQQFGYGLGFLTECFHKDK